jgi:hypothetical protein
MDVVVLFFLLGVVARLAGSDLRLPEALYETLSIYLLLAIGLRGGAELSEQSILAVAPQALAVIAFGALIPLIAFPVLHRLGRLNRFDSAAIAAHYGSVSVVTFAVAVAYLMAREVAFEKHFPLFVALMEAPAIVVGVLLARSGAASKGRGVDWGTTLHEVLLGKSVVLLLGGLAIGWVAGHKALAPIEPLWFGLFKGVLALFLLEMGLVAASRIGEVRRHGVFLVAFGIAMPLLAAVLGVALARAVGMSEGGTMLLATLGASASYIAAPAALRIAVPEANPALSIGASLGVTFPFNVTLGIPIYLRLAQWAHS